MSMFIGLFCIAFCMIASALGPILIRKKISFESLKVNNEVAGFKYATLGAVYAVLLSFVVFVVWGNYSETDERCNMEASQVADLFRLSEGFPAPFPKMFQSELKNYAEFVIEKEWPLLRSGKVTLDPPDLYQKLWGTYLNFTPKNEHESVLYQASLQNLDQLSDYRRLRLLSARTEIPKILWLTLLAGAFATISFTFFFGSHNVRAQAYMTSLLTGVICLILFVIVSMDHAFTGPLALQPEGMEAVLHAMGNDNLAER
jgi:hypothetical protein